MADDQTFKLESSRARDSVIVTVFGEIDLSTADQVTSEILAVTDGLPRVVVDLSGVSFVDSSGLNALLRPKPPPTGRRNPLPRAKGGLTGRDIAMRCVVPDRSVVRRVIEITHLIEQLSVVGTLPD